MANTTSSSGRPVNRDTATKHPRNWPWKDIFFAGLGLVVFTILITLLWRIVTANTSLRLMPTGAESAALIRANDRIVQLTQWTISTVLVVAGGLIGLNWYRDEKRYDREQATIANRFAELQNQLGTLSEVVAGNQGQIANISRESAHGLFSQTMRDLQQTDDLYEMHDIIEEARGRLVNVETAPQIRCKGLIEEGAKWMMYMTQNGVYIEREQEWEVFFDFWQARLVDYPDLAAVIQKLLSNVNFLLTTREEEAIVPEARSEDRPEA